MHPASVDGTQPRPLMIYVNIPFCRSKCSFCDHVQPIQTSDLLRPADDPVRQRYIQALCHEIRLRGGASPPWPPADVLYWGGGTASILEAEEISAIMAALRDSFDLSQVREATIECSPDTINPHKLALFVGLGFNRFSSGVQSFDDGRLRALGRQHTAEGARDAVRWAREAGFERVSIDIMCGFPDEDLAEVQATTEAALALAVDQVSLYPFRPTPGTHMRRAIERERTVLRVARQKAAFREGRRLLSNAGYPEYASGYFGPPSLFALWYFQMRADLLGIGSGAMSLYQQRFRAHQKGQLERYIANPAQYQSELPAAAAPIIVSGLRAGISCFDGIPRDMWQIATGTALDSALDLEEVRPLANYLREWGLIEDEYGIRLPAEIVGDVLIELSFTLLQQLPSRPVRLRTGPKTGRRSPATEA